MALVKRQSNSTRLLIIFFVVVVVGGVGYFLAQQFFSGSGNANGDQLGVNSRRVITNFGQQIFNDDRYTSLQTFGSNMNIDANVEAGQPNPFQ